jgi:hypothetical protein
MGFFGNLIGSGLGGLGGALIGNPSGGADFGSKLGNLLPFRRGGMVPRPNALLGGVPVALKKRKAPKRHAGRKRVHKK